MDHFEIPGYGKFKLIRPLVGFKRAMEAQIERFPYACNVFLMMKFRRKNKLLSDFILQELQQHGFKGVRADDPDWNITRNVYNPIAVLYCCRFGLALFDEPEEGQAYSPNVAYELGMMHYQDKNCLILRNENLPPVPFDLVKDLYNHYRSDLEVRAIIEQWVKNIQNEEIDSAYERTISSATPLANVIDFSSLRPKIRRYLRENNILFVSDVYKIDFETLLMKPGVGRISVARLIKELISNGILQESEYLKRFF